jgi:hypothetical protein
MRDQPRKRFKAKIAPVFARLRLKAMAKGEEIKER